MISEVLGSWVPRAIVEKLRGLLPSKPSYLDLGCGDGGLTMKVADIIGASEVYGVDVDEGALAEASRKGVKTLKCNLDEAPLPFNDDSFDLVTAFEVIEHLNNPKHMLREAFRVLRRGGIIMIETPNTMGCASRFIADQLKLATLIIGTPRTSSYPIEAREAQGFNPQSLRSTLIEVGFEVLGVYGVSHPPIELPLIPVIIEEIGELSTSAAPHIIAIAQKKGTTLHVEAQTA
ncbi:MAG: methyltransferase domain-containing protein [Candidatus Nezhaarchaeales archaeon]